MVVRELITRLGFKTDQKALDAFEKRVQLAKRGLQLLTGAAIVGAGAIFGLAKQAGDTGDEIAAMAERLGIGTTALQEWRYAAKLSDVETGQLDQSLGFLNRTLGEARGGSKGAREALANLGVSMDDVRSKDPTAILDQIAGRLATTGDAAEHTNDIMAVFGRSGAALIPMLNKGSAGLAQLRQEAHDLGTIMGEDAVRAAGDFDDAWKRAMAVLDGLRLQLGAELLPDVTAVLIAFREWVKANREWIRSSIQSGLRGLVALVRFTWEWVSRIVRAMNDAAEALGGWQQVARLTALALAVLGAAEIIGGLRALAALLRTVAAAGALASLSTIGLAALVVALAIAIQDLNTWIEGGDSLIGRWLGSWADLKATVKAWIDEAGADFRAFFSGLRDAVANFVNWVLTQLERLYAPIKMVTAPIRGALRAVGLGPGDTAGSRLRREEAQVARRERTARNNLRAEREGSFSPEELAAAVRFQGRRGGGGTEVTNEVKTTINLAVPASMSKEQRDELEGRMRTILAEDRQRSLRQLQTAAAPAE